MSDAKKLHLGSGSISLAGWINIDLETPEADLLLDLREPLPFDAESVSHIFSEHVIEHVEYDDGLRLLRECRRVLRPDGVIRVTTPDLAWLVESYLSGVTDGWGELWQPGSPARMINQGMRYWGHCFIYDRAELLRIFHEAGFGDVRFVEWRKSEDPVLDGLETRPHNNELIVEARIPPRPASNGGLEGVRGYLGRNESDLMAAQGRELERLRLEAAEASARQAHAEASAGARLNGIIAESDERGRLLRELEIEYRDKQAENAALRAKIQSLESENEFLVAASSDLRKVRVELDRVQRELLDVAAESRARADEIAKMAAILQRHESYMQRLRGSFVGRILLYFFKPNNAV